MLLRGCTIAGVLLIIAVSVSCNGDVASPVRPSETAPRPVDPSPSPGITAAASPDASALVGPDVVVDQTLELSLDGATRHLVVISHGVLVDKGGQPAAPLVPVVCPSLEGTAHALSPCQFHADIFAHDAATDAWAKVYRLDPRTGGDEQSLVARALEFDPGKDAVIVTSTICAASNCPAERQRVVAVRAGEIVVVLDVFPAPFYIADRRAAFSVPAYPAADSDIPWALCCPNGFVTWTVGAAATTHELAIVDAAYGGCSVGTLVRPPDLPPRVIFVRCGEMNPAQGYEIADEAIIDPPEVGGVTGLRDGDRVRVEYSIRECPGSLLECQVGGSITLLASRITVLP